MNLVNPTLSVHAVEPRFLLSDCLAFRVERLSARFKSFSLYNGYPALHAA